MIKLKLLLLLVSLTAVGLSACVYTNAQGCDSRCSCCMASGLSNYDCDTCNTSLLAYMWLDTSASQTGATTGRCETYCPPGQYINVSQGSCAYCDPYCQTCNASSYTNCLTCSPTAFLYNSTTCYNLPNPTYNGISYYNPCVDGTYAWPLTMSCINCPTGALTCSLRLEYMMPSSYQSSKTMTTGCTNDPNCLWAIQSYTCSLALGYYWVQYFCLPINQCRQYAYYASSSSAFDPSACTCLPNYYQTGVMSCSRCDISCLECTFSDSGSCTNCPDGFTVEAGSCVTNGTSVVMENWGAGGSELTATYDPGTGVTGSFTDTSGVFTTDCGYGTMRYLWGCTLATCYSGALTYTATSVGTDHYGIRLRFAAVFIDNWPSTGALYVTSGSNNVFSYNYNSYGVVGEFLCLKNVLDVVQVIDGWWNDTSNSLSFTLTHNGGSVGGYYLGIRELIIYKLKCDSSCATCSSYTANDCTSCPNIGQIVFNGTCDPTAGDCTNLPTPPGQCVCDTGRGYFYNGTACVISCPNNATDFKDKASRSCVPTCPPPLLFGDTSDIHRYCKITCPSGYYKNAQTSTYMCSSSCYIPGTANNQNYFMYNGSDPTCFNVCPSGLVADEYFGACLQTCTAGYFNYSGYCALTCPAGYFAYNVTNNCLIPCPDGYFQNNKTGTGVGICEYPCTSWLGVNLYGDNSTGSCVNICPNGTYADPSSKMCVTFCNLSGVSYQYNLLVNTTIGGTVYWIGTCVTMCTSNFLGNGISYGNPITGFCVNATDCPINYYGDSAAGLSQNMCVVQCSDILQFGVNATRTCQNSCGINGGYKYNTTKVCVSICPTIPSLFGNENGYCVAACTGAYFADAQANRTCRLNCSATPAASFGQNFVCISSCANISAGNPSWGDPYSSTRACTTNCTYNPTNQSYGYTPLNLCVLVCPDTWFGYVQLIGVPICTQTCPLIGYNYFGDNLTNLCTTNCPTGYFGDSTGNRLCVKECPATYFAYTDNSNLRTCVQTCPTGYADNATRVCVTTYTGCGNGTYGNDADNKCQLPGFNCLNFADPTTQSCQITCPDNASYRYFGDPTTFMCVLICPNYTANSPQGTFGDNNTDTCEELCTSASEVRDYQNNRRCVADSNCSRSPAALFADLVNKICVTALFCPLSTFADNFTNKCQTTCQGPTLLYADPVSRFCVAICPNNYYAVNSSTLNGICNTTCIVPLWADNLTIQCTSRCSVNTYGVNYTLAGYSQGVCQSECPLGQFARDTDNLCVSDCGPGLWGQTTSGKCLTAPSQCPSGYYANNVSNLCVLPINCQLVGSIKYVADNSTSQCVPICPLTTPRNYADMNKQLCVMLCPIGKLGQNNTLQCLDECMDYSSGTYLGYYADSQIRICVTVCSASPIPTYGQNITYTCVEAYLCPSSTWAEDTVYYRQCVPMCPPPNTRAGNLQEYADNTTQSCVVSCPQNYYGSMYTGVGMCVSLCDINTLFADNYTKTCVSTCPSSQATFGDQNTRTCVDVCPLNYYAQTPSRYCVSTCRAGTWGEPIARVCLTDNTACPIVNSYKQYADNSSNMCVSTCPILQDTWGENSTWYCVSTCSTGFKYTPTRVCINICPLYLNGTGLFSDAGMCYDTCVTNNYYRDPQASRSCVGTCSNSPNASYADPTTMSCVQTCPSYPVMYYAYDGNWTCQTTCVGGTFVDPTSQKCVSGCPSGTILDPNTNTCVSECPYDVSAIYYADLTEIQPICVLAASCPSGYYGDFNIRQCTQTCSTGLYKNNDTKTCVTFCPVGLYGSSTGYCVSPSNCPANQYANNLTHTCVSICNGSFADTSNKVCVFVCPAGLYADTYTRICSSNCTNNATVQLYISVDNQTCVSACQPPLFLDVVSNTCENSCPSPYYADPSTSVCVTSCPISPQLYGLDNGRVCVEFCPTGTPQYYTNNQTRMCVTACDPGYYRDNITLSCVTQCADPYFIDDTVGYCVLNCTPRFALDVNNTCLNTCPSPYYEDSTTYKCVVNCPIAPTYYKLVVGTSRTCSTLCPPGQWADLSSLSCVTSCPSSPPRYADNSTWSCVSVCPYQNGAVPFSYYALNSTRMCVSICPMSMFAQNTTRSCVYQCPNGTNTYADNTLSIPACVSLCSAGLFADPVSLTCTSVCPSSPRTFSYQNLTARVCVASCPYPLVSDNSTYSCVTTCPSATYPYLDISTKSCVANCPASINFFGYLATGTTTGGNCQSICPNGYFSGNTTRTCVTRCPNGYYGETQNNTCSLTCTEINGHYADSANNLCVAVCPYNNTYDSYGDKYTRNCVLSCNISDFTFADPNTRLCEETCSVSPSVLYKDPTTMKCVSSCPNAPPVRYFSDNVTMTCVQSCSIQSQSYGNILDRSCYIICPGGLFANDVTRLCGAATDCQVGYFADRSTWTCVAICPASQNTFGDPTTSTCLGICPSSYFRDNSTQLCVLQCPQAPNLFADNSSSNCVANCPIYSYADNSTRICVANCPNIPTQTFADNSTNLCVQTCPTQPDYFSENITWTCVLTCPIAADMYADYSTRQCVLNCPSDGNNTFADSQSRLCVNRCPDSPIMTFNDNVTQRCQTSCSTGFADSVSKFCVALCPEYYYGETYTYTCVATCPIKIPKLFAEDASRMCVTDCNATLYLYADSYTSRCVQVCPEQNGTFSDNISQTCVSQCPPNPVSYADPSTRSCVSQCPIVPALFAINSTRVCVSICPSGSFSDNSTRLCVAYCNTTSPVTYGDNSTSTCVSICPTTPWYFADPSTHLCVILCPGDTYADNTTRTCVYPCADATTYADPTTHTCVTTCPNGTFGQNTTMRCLTVCPPGSFADVLLNLCVSGCTVDPIYYGDPLTQLCVPQCPSSSISFGNPLTQQCVTFNSSGYSGCPLYYFSDNSTRLCVSVCPMAQDTYSDNFTRKCVSTCPNSTLDTYADNSTMRCVALCPSMPDYYAETTSRRCVKLCLQPNATFNGTFANNVSRRCESTCPSTPDYYSDNSTSRCVYNCPVDPLTFADNSTRRCVSVCPDSPQDLYGDLKSGRCVILCPQEESTYADNTTRMCQKVCNATALLFGQNSTNRCVRDCPNGSYADNSSRLCVAVCPNSQDTYGDSTTNTCVSQCPIGWFADTFSQTCMQVCPFVTTPVIVNTYGNLFTRRCVAQCPFDQNTYADDLTHTCVATCPLSMGTYADDTTKRCVNQCPDVPFLYAQNITRTCASICPNTTGGGFAENNSRICVAKCPDNTYGDPVSLYCKFYCQTGYYADDTSNTCVTMCSIDLFADNTTQKCVAICPVSHLLFGVLLTRTCDPTCPDGYYADAYTQTCQTQCPSSQDTYAYAGNNTCVNECPSPLYAYNVTQVCVAICPDPYYPDIQDHRCYQCPLQCSACSYSQMCTQCTAGYYLYSGQCVASCPIVPVVTYANINGTCGTSLQCSAGYFALNSTKSCVTTCPSGYYKNSITQTCEYCMKGCSNCNNYSVCLACDQVNALWDNYICYPYCSRLMHYYYGSGCVSACPAGTYLNLTFCTACSAICGTCQLQPSNCLTCADGLYLQNHLCVQTCPSNSRPIMANGSLTCQPCATGGLNCTVTAQLNYTINQTVENYKFKLYLTFNQPVKITGNIQDVFQIIQVSSRRLLADQSTVNYTIIIYANGVYGFLINGFDANANSGIQFELQILDPTAVVSTTTGSIPQQTRMQVIIPTIQYYSLDNYNKNFNNYASFVTWLSIIMFVGLVWTKPQVWMPMFDLLQILYVLYFINVLLPPSAAYMLAGFRNSFLSFLPNMFANVLPKPIMNDKSTGQIYSLIGDIMFLRNEGYLLTITLALMIFVGIILLLIKNKTIIKDNNRRLRLKKIWKDIILGRCLQGLIYLLFLPAVFFALFQMRDYRLTYPVIGFSIFASLVYLVLFLLALSWFLYKVISFARKYPLTMEALGKAYNLIKESPAQLMEIQEHKFKLDDNQIDLRNLSEPRINGKLIIPFSIETHMESYALAAPFVGYFYKLFIAVFMVAAFNNPLAQNLLLIALALCYLGYLIRVKPYIYKKHKYMLKNWLVIANTVMLILIELTLLVFQVKYTQLNQTNRVMIGDIACYLITVTLTYNLIFLGYRFFQEWHYKIWRPFVYSECFKDNFPIEHFEFVDEYENQKKQTHKVLKKKKKKLIEDVNAIDKETAKLQVNMNDSKGSKNQVTQQIGLRPTQKQILKKDIENFMNDVYEREKSYTHKSSSSLSRKDRKKMVEMIFAEKPLEVHAKDTEFVQIQPRKSRSDSNHDIKDLERPVALRMQSQDSPDEYEYEQYEEEYPENTDINDILTGRHKSNVVLP